MEALEAIDGGDAGARLLRDLKFITGSNKNITALGMDENELVINYNNTIHKLYINNK